MIDFPIIGPYYERDPQYLLVQTVPPVSEPVNYSELSNHLRLDQTFDEAYVVALGVAGRQYVETATKLSLMQATYAVSFDTFGGWSGLRLPRRPVVAVTGITYLDQSGTVQTIAPSSYVVDTKSIWTRIRPAFGGTWPMTQNGTPNAVTITFVAGTVATDPTQVTPLGKLAIWTWVAAQYENREAVNTGKTGAVLPHSFDAVLRMLSAPEVR